MTHGLADFLAQEELDRYEGWGKTEGKPSGKSEMKCLGKLRYLVEFGGWFCWITWARGLAFGFEFVWSNSWVESLEWIH